MKVLERQPGLAAPLSRAVARVTAGREMCRLPGFHLALRQLSTDVVVQEIDWRDRPDHDEDWADGMAAGSGGRNSRDWRQNYEREILKGGRPRYAMLAEDVHVRTIRLADLLDGHEWTLYRSLDHGVAHHTCCAWLAVNKEGDRYFYRQYYQNETTVAVNCRHILGATVEGEVVRRTVADPSIWNRKPDDLKPLADEYAKSGLVLTKAENAMEVGCDAVESGFISALARWSLFHDRLHPQMDVGRLDEQDVKALAVAPAIWFSPACAGEGVSLFEQCRQLRWKEPRGDPEQTGLPEKLQDVNDEGPDVVRYAVATPGLGWARPSGPRDLSDWVEEERRKTKRRLAGGRRRAGRR